VFGWTLGGLALTAPALGAPPALGNKGAPAVKLGAPPDMKTEAKVNGYITLMNAESGPLFEERANWVSKLADSKAGPTCKEPSPVSLLRGVDNSSLETYAGYKKQLLLAPKLPSDEAALVMVEALQDLVKPSMDAAPYFTNPTLSKDRCAKSKALHPIVMADWDKYIAAHERLRAFVDKFTDDRDLRELQTTEKKYGKKYRWEFARLVLGAKNLIRTISVQTHKPDPDTAPIKDSLLAFSQVVDESKSLMNNDPAAKTGEPYPPGFSLTILDSTPIFVHEVQRYIDTAENKTAKNRIPALKGEWDNVVSNYNKMIEQMNGVMFDSKQK
jgi:Protein of unknown function (DUF3829)